MSLPSIIGTVGKGASIASKAPITTVVSTTANVAKSTSQAASLGEKAVKVSKFSKFLGKIKTKLHIGKSHKSSAPTSPVASSVSTSGASAVSQAKLPSPLQQDMVTVLPKAPTKPLPQPPVKVSGTPAPTKPISQQQYVGIDPTTKRLDFSPVPKSGYREVDPTVLQNFKESKLGKTSTSPSTGAPSNHPLLTHQSKPLPTPPVKSSTAQPSSTNIVQSRLEGHDSAASALTHPNKTRAKIKSGRRLPSHKPTAEAVSTPVQQSAPQTVTQSVRKQPPSLPSRDSRIAPPLPSRGSRVSAAKETTSPQTRTTISTDSKPPVPPKPSQVDMELLKLQKEVDAMSSPLPVEKIDPELSQIYETQSRIGDVLARDLSAPRSTRVRSEATPKPALRKAPSRTEASTSSLAPRQTELRSQLLTVQKDALAKHKKMLESIDAKWGPDSIAPDPKKHLLAMNQYQQKWRAIQTARNPQEATRINNMSIAEFLKQKSSI